MEIFFQILLTPVTASPILGDLKVDMVVPLQVDGNPKERASETLIAVAGAAPGTFLEAADMEEVPVVEETPMMTRSWYLFFPLSTPKIMA